MNLSQDPRFAENAVKENGVSRAMQGLVEKEGGHNDLLVMLLANLTHTEEGARSLLQVGGLTIPSFRDFAKRKL